VYVLAGITLLEFYNRNSLFSYLIKIFVKFSFSSKFLFYDVVYPKRSAVSIIINHYRHRKRKTKQLIKVSLDKGKISQIPPSSI